MKKWHLIIDVEKCQDCNNCFMACKDEHLENDWPGYSQAQPRHGQRWINIMRVERGQFPLIDVAYLPSPCMHCDNPSCLKVANGAVTKRPDGIVLIDPNKSWGQKELVKACPYNAIWWNEEKQIPQKCTFCAHLLDDGWTKPRCVQACPTGALRVVFLEDSDWGSLVNSEELGVLYPELNTSPCIYYKNLYRYFSCFLAGSVEANKEGIVDCVEGASVRLYNGQELVAESITDNFGDFKIDKLLPYSGSYTLEIEKDEQKAKVNVKLEATSLYLGNISLSV